ncbi:MAG TPA: SAM-dependent methyltransferase [Pyrinomonadaceae bacterium]|nr:SAM-dependent methyltransferase [Pyrinomonadaceae bacterium]
MKPISQTAFYCCGVRMQDAASDKPVCGDVYAKVFMNEEGLRILEKFKDETNPNTSNVARARMVDDLLREELRANPNLRVVLIGAGFDSRAYRLKGGTWFELDEPQVIAYKNERLPVSQAQNPLQRIAIDFSTESLEEKLSAAASDSGPTVVVIEGVFMYLEEESIRQLLQTLHRLFPEHKLICDLMTRKFFEKYGRTIHEKLTGMGATFKFTVKKPEELFLRSGYRRVACLSVVERSAEYQSRAIPKILARTFLRTLTRGYAIYVFASA